jgi:hypothetical protein
MDRQRERASDDAEVDLFLSKRTLKGIRETTREKRWRERRSQN